MGASMRLGQLRALQGRSAEAIAAYMQELEFLNGIDHALRSRVIVELNVRLGAAHLSLGETRKGHALLDVAIDAFDRRVRLGADEPFTRYYAAAAHALKGDADTAIAFLERAATDAAGVHARAGPHRAGIRCAAKRLADAAAAAASWLANLQLGTRSSSFTAAGDPARSATP